MEGDYTDDLATLSASSLADFGNALRQAYELGVKAGKEQMRNAILAITDAPFSGTRRQVSPASNVEDSPGTISKRAPRGSVRSAIKQVLRHHPEGMTEQELGQAAAKLNPELSPNSMGSELGRHRGKLYRMSGGKWFLIAHVGDMETAEGADTPTAVPSTSATMEETRAPDTAIIT